MKYVEPVTHTVVIKHRDGRPFSRFSTPYPDDAQRYVTALTSANSDLVAEFNPVEQSPMDNALREWAA